MAATPVGPRQIGRYALYGAIATGGMATVHVGRLVGRVGFARTVAIKRLHPQFAADPEFVSMFTDEARLAGRIRHPNVVSVTDVIADDGEVLIVMDYVQGETLSRLVRAAIERAERVPPGVVAAIMCDVLEGLHAAHESRDEHGEPLHIVHRDVSPQNVIVGADGIARLLDFGVAKAAGRAQVTREGQLKGKLSYMAPEQLEGKAVTRLTDVFAASVVFWEALTGKRLFVGENEGDIVRRILVDQPPSPSSVEPSLAVYDDVLAKGLARLASDRFSTAREMAAAIAAAAPKGEAHEVASWVERIAADTLLKRRDLISAMESMASAPSLPDAPTRAELATDIADGATAARWGRWLVAGGLGVVSLAAVAIGGIAVAKRSAPPSSHEPATPPPVVAPLALSAQAAADAGALVQRNILDAAAGVRFPPPLTRTAHSARPATEPQVAHSAASASPRIPDLL